MQTSENPSGQSSPPSEAPDTSAEVEHPPMEGMTKKSNWSRFIDFFGSRAKSVNIGHLLLILLFLHLFAMAFPNGKGDYVFDEQYYVPSAKDLLALVPNNLEHPFFGKIWGALGIALFGDNFFGWRIFSVVIGVLSVWVLYELARVFLTRERALFAASMLGFETLFFIHTSLLLLEGPPIFFALLGFLGYFKKHYYWSAVAFGLSILSKEWGIYFVAALFFYHVWATKKVPLSTLLSGPSLKKLVVFSLLLLVVVGIPLQAYDAIYKPSTGSTESITKQVIIYPQNSSTTTVYTTSTKPTGQLTYFWQNFAYYYTYHTGLTVTNSDLATNPWVYIPWLWIVPFKITPMPYYVTTVTVTVNEANGAKIVTNYHPIDWLGIGNLVIWYSIWLIVPVLLIRVLTGKVGQFEAFVGSWIGLTYLPSVFLYLGFHRVLYPFYFVNVDPGLALGIPLVISFIAPDGRKMERILMAVWFAAAVIFFILFFPVHPLDMLSTS
jgi:4-amino-4-deoxy-L-arabinose transferase-like glycosyltransferase